MKKTFDELVKDRANERVQAKLKKFKLTAVQAALDLMGYAPGGWTAGELLKGSQLDAQLKATFTRMAGEHRTGWPRILWDKEEELVAKELLATMDEMRRALLASREPRPEDSSPEGVEIIEPAPRAVAVRVGADPEDEPF